MPAADPNFPIGGLDIVPSYERFKAGRGKDGEAQSSPSWQRDSHADITSFGIAGRIWEAAYILQRYLTPPSEHDIFDFEPPCSIFANDEPVFAVELGAGVGLVGIHLATMLGNGTSGPHCVVLTDLENVMPLMQRNIDAARSELGGSVDLTCAPLPWGSESHARDVCAAAASAGDHSSIHIICSDLVYFTELLAPLLRTLITLSATQSKIIIGYKIRSLTKEETFWNAFGVWFDFEPVRVRVRKSTPSGSAWQRFGSRQAHLRAQISQDQSPADDDLYIFVAERKAATRAFVAPASDDALLAGMMQAPTGELVQGSGADTFECLRMAESMPFD